MHINGVWSLCDDDVLRPVIYGEILTGSGLWVPTEFLVDTGADRTVLSAATLAILHLQPLATQVVDRPGQVVALLGQRHQYIIVQT